MTRLIFAVALLLLGVAWLFQERRQPVPSPMVMAEKSRENRNVPAEISQPIGNGSATVVIPRAPDGHFYVDGQVGAATVHFVVDTGATMVALSRADAQRAGIGVANGDFDAKAATANGEVAVRPVTIDRLRVGSLEAQAVPGVVIDGDLNISLLGQSWLKQVGSVTIEGDRMVLK